MGAFHRLFHSRHQAPESSCSRNSATEVSRICGLFVHWWPILVFNLYFDRLFPREKMAGDFGLNPSMDADCSCSRRLHASVLLPVAKKSSQRQLTAGQMASTNPLATRKRFSRIDFPRAGECVGACANAQVQSFDRILRNREELLDLLKELCDAIKSVDKKPSISFNPVENGGCSVLQRDFGALLRRRCKPFSGAGLSVPLYFGDGRPIFRIELRQ